MIDLIGSIVITFPDGTYAPLRGCEALEIGERGLERLAEGEAVGEVTPRRYFTLTNPVHLRMLADHIEANRW